MHAVGEGDLIELVEEVATPLSINLALAGSFGQNRKVGRKMKSSVDAATLPLTIIEVYYNFFLLYT